MRTRDCSTLKALLLAAVLIGPSAYAAVPDIALPTGFRYVHDTHCTRNGFGVVQCRVPGHQPIDIADTCVLDASTFGGGIHPGCVTLLDRFPDARTHLGRDTA